VATESTPSKVLDSLRQKGLGDALPHSLSFVDAFHETVGLPSAARPDVVDASPERARAINTTDQEFDNLTAFGDVVVALGHPQYAEDTFTRKVEIYRATNGSLKLVYSQEFTTNPPYAGGPSADAELSRAVAKRFFEDVLIGHDLAALAEIVSPDILIHPTAMPCEASYYGINGVGDWLGRQWKAFPDLTITDYFTIAQGDIVAAHWTACGTSKGNFMMLPPTGDPVEYTGASMYRIEDKKIAEIWETRNSLGIMRQLNPDIGKDRHSH
jgi:predicted ester cyclase